MDFHITLEIIFFDTSETIHEYLLEFNTSMIKVRTMTKHAIFNRKKTFEPLRSFSSLDH